MKKLINISVVIFVVALTIQFLSGQSAAMTQEKKNETLGSKEVRIQVPSNALKGADELVNEKPVDKSVMTISIVNLIAISILVVVTAWYAYSTFQVLKEMQKQARLITLSIAASVEAGIASLPSPGQLSKAQNDALYILLDLREKMDRELMELGM